MVKLCKKTLLLLAVVSLLLTSAVFNGGIVAKSAEAELVTPTRGANFGAENFDLGRTLDSAPLTFEAWLQINSSLAPNSNNLFGVVFGNYDGSNDGNAIGLLICGNATKAYPQIKWGKTVYNFNTVNLKSSSFIHVAITLNLETKQLLCYKNGVLAQTVDAPAFSKIKPDGATFFIGRDGRKDGGASCFKGRIHSFTAFSTVRTESEIVSDADSVPVYTGTEQDLLYSIEFNTDSASELFKKKGYSYISDAGLKSAPQTFETWIKLPADLPDNKRGGSLFTNYINPDYPNGKGLYIFEISTHGHLSLRWNHKDFRHTFSSADLRTGKWEHIALVSDVSKGTVKFYLNGELLETCQNLELQKDVNRQAFAVGADLRCGGGISKIPFLGEIRQMSAYSKPLTEEQINADMEKTCLSGADLLFDWYIPEGKYLSLDTETVKDNSDNASDLRLASYGLTWLNIDRISDFDYSFIALPDTQNLTDYRPDNMRAMMSAIRGQANVEKVKFLMHVGDHANRLTDRERQFQDARQAMSFIDGVIPYAFVPGNHDYADNEPNVRSNLALFNQSFTYDYYKTVPTFGGVYTVGDMGNSYHLFEQAGVKYLIMALECYPRDEVLTWADGITKKYADRRTIVITHSYLNPAKGRTAYGESVWNKYVKKNNNIFMVLCGHIHNSDPVLNVVKGDNGNNVIELLLDMQNTFDEGGHGVPLALMMKFNEDEKNMYCYLYKPQTNQLMNKHNQFTVNFADEKNPTVGLAKTVDDNSETNSSIESSDPVAKSGCKSAITVAPIISLSLICACLVLIERKRNNKAKLM